MTKDRENLIERMVKISQDDQTKHVNYFSRCPLSMRVEIFDFHRDILHKLRNQHKDEANLSDISYCAFILAIGTTRTKEKALVAKSYGDLSLDEIRNLSSIRAVKFAKKDINPTGKHEKLMGYWAIVRTLRLDHGYSYDRVSLYLKKKHRFSVAPSTIMKKWKEIEENSK